MLTHAYETGWIRSWHFDKILILGCFALSLVCGSLSYFNPNYYHIILFLNIWLLGYHHVIATYTRFLEQETNQNYRWLITWLPIVVVMVIIAIAMIGDMWLLATIYLYWQCFHYARQAHGIAQAYRYKVDKEVVTLPPILHNILVYGMPLWGILYRSAQQPEAFLGMPIKVIPYMIAMPLEIIMNIMMIGALLAYLGFMVYQIHYKYKKLALGYHLFTLTHIVIFYVGYIFIDDINRGWLFLNIWHNAQYIIFVWLFNVKKCQNIQDKFSKGNLYQWLCNQNAYLYFFSTLTATFIFYFIVRNITHFTINFTGSEAILITMIMYQAVNFHHYIVDGFIWKMRKKSVRNTLSLQ